MHTTCATIAPPPSTSCWASLRFICPVFDSAQRASAFNQPLSLDTSSVTDMSDMFQVRSARATCTLSPRPLLCIYHLRRRPSALPPPGPLPPRPTLYALSSAQQEASAFNQPLGLDTSSVTDMAYMFQVRSAHAMRPVPGWALSCTPRPLPLPYHPSAILSVPRPASYALFSTPQEASAFNQPLSLDTSKVTNMGFMFQVRLLVP